jgi:hypothetical protein
MAGNSANGRTWSLPADATRASTSASLITLRPEWRCVSSASATMYSTAERWP